MTLGLYLVRRLVNLFLVILGVFMGVLALFEMVEALRRFGGTEVSLGDIAILAALSVPKTLYQILPLLILLAAMFSALSLAASSELVVIRAAGRSALRALLEPTLAAFLLGVVAVGFGNPLVAAANRAYQDQLAKLASPSVQARISLDGRAIWLRQGEGARQTVIRAVGVGPEGLSFRDVTFLIFATAYGPPLVRLHAEAAALEPGGWMLHKVKRWDLTAANPEAEAEELDHARLPTELTAERIRQGFERATTVSVWSLPEFIRLLERAGLNATPQRVQWQAELALPLSMAGMVLLGSMLCLKPARLARTGVAMLMTVLLGLGLFFLRNFAQLLAENGQVQVALAVWGPPLAGLMLALGVLLSLEDG